MLFHKTFKKGTRSFDHAPRRRCRGSYGPAFAGIQNGCDLSDRGHSNRNHRAHGFEKIQGGLEFCSHSATSFLELKALYLNRLHYPPGIITRISYFYRIYNRKPAFAQVESSKMESQLILPLERLFILSEQSIRTCSLQFHVENFVETWYSKLTHTSGGFAVVISYKKLWKLLIDRDMLKKDLRIAAGLSTNVIAKLGKNENVSTEVLGKICKVLNCNLNDIVEFIDDDKVEKC